MENKYILFLDNISRTILATFVDETPHTLVVKNPVVVQILSDNQTKFKVQFVPLLFRDWQLDSNEDPLWTYNTSDITRVSLTAFTERFIKQYDFVASLTPEKAAQLTAERQKKTDAQSAQAPVVKLFDDKKE